MINETRLYYDKTAEKIANEWYGNELLLPSIQEFVSLLPPGARVLDMGCGPGHESIKLAKTGVETVGIDYSKMCIKIARERCPECRFEVMDFLDLNIEFGKFDGVFFSGSLPHIRPQDIQRVFRNIRSILLDKGYLEIITVEGEGIGYEMRHQVFDGIILKYSVYLYTKERLIGKQKKRVLNI